MLRTSHSFAVTPLKQVYSFQSIFESSLVCMYGMCMCRYLFVSPTVYSILSPILIVNMRIAVILGNVSSRAAERIVVAMLNSSLCTHVLHTNLYVYQPMSIHNQYYRLIKLFYTFIYTHMFSTLRGILKINVSHFGPDNQTTTIQLIDLASRLKC